MVLKQLFFIMLCCLVFTGIVLAQTADDLPPIYITLFSQNTISAILVVVGAVKLIRNLFGERAKGWIGVVITFAGALLYGVVQYGVSDDGLVYGIIIGLLSAAAFYLTKNLEKVRSIDVDMRYDFFVGLGKVIKYILVRK